MTEQTLLLGTAKIDITPPVGTLMAGFVAREGKASGVHDRLEANVLLFQSGEEKLALVMADLIGVDAALIEEVRRIATRLTDLPATHIVIGAIHTHGGPAVLRGGFLGEPDPSYLAFLAHSIAVGISQADQGKEPVKVYSGCGECREVGKNRRRPGGPTDPEVSVLRFEGAAGTKAVLVNYACHPVVLGPDNLLITADYPSYLRQTLSAIYPCALVVFATGADGNINTGHQARASIDGRLGKKRTFAEAQRLGRILAGEALKALETATEIDNPSLKVKGTTVALPLEKIPSAGEYERMKLEWEEKYRSLKAAGGSFGEIEEAQLMADWAEKMKQKWSGRSEEPKILCELTVFTLGDCEFYTLPGEFFFEFGLMLKEARRPRPLFVLGYTNGCIGYVAPEAAYKEGGYEIDDSYRYYGLPARLLKGGGEQVVQALLALVKTLS